LGTSPLASAAAVTARLAADAATDPGSTTDPGSAVEQAIRDAAAVVAAAPADRRGYRALHHTYLQPAGTQERAAEVLNLPMSTYRRHLAAGIGRLTSVLWRAELDARNRAGNGRKVDGFRSGM
jgi:hypothetical protein